jgi:nucleoside-diphosphate kinase
MNEKEIEQTLVLIKPDALKNSLTGYVLSQFSEFHSGLRFAALKVVHVSNMLAEEHYAEHAGKVFFPALIEYITGRIHYPNEPQRQRVIAIVYQGPNAVRMMREMAGPTNPHQAREQKPGCVRSLGTVVVLRDADGKEIGQRMDNLVHASATEAEAEREIKLWFRPDDIPPLMRAYKTKYSDRSYYYKDKKLLTKYEPGSFCFIAPGDVVWESDLAALEAMRRGEESGVTLHSVVAKYLINVIG